MRTGELAAVWRKLEQELRRLNGESVDQMLLPPASIGEISEIEATAGTLLPTDYRESLLVHSGTSYWAWLWDAVALNTPAQVVEEWEQLRLLAEHPRNRFVGLQAEPGVRSDMFHPHWIPVAADNGIPICLDLAPAKGGCVGQVILVDWEDERTKIIAPNFLGFLLSGLAKLQVQ